MILAACAQTGPVDDERLLEAIATGAWDRLRQMTTGRSDVTWDGLERALVRFDPGRVGAYLSTKGAVGIALNDKLRSYLLYELAPQLTARVDAGAFDRPE